MGFLDSANAGQPPPTDVLASTVSAIASRLLR